MQFSPYFLLRKPIYNLSHLDVFAIDSSTDEFTEEEIENKRKHFLSFIESEYLLLSLPFSSKTLYQAVPHYEFHATVKIRKKEKQTERAIAKYLFRMALNASPLAAFAGSQFVNWDQKIMPAKSKYVLSLALEQRKEFFDLCYCDVDLQGFMRYRLSPSLRETEDGFSYLNHEEGEVNLVHLEHDADFEAMYSSLSQEDFTFGEFVSKTDYDVNDFLESQLIVPSYPVYSDMQIIKEILGSIADRYKIDFGIAVFEDRGFDELDDKKVIAIQNDWINKLAKYADKLEVKLNNKVYSERVFYLNSYVSNTKVPSIDRAVIGKEISHLAQLILNCSESKVASSLSWESLLSKPEDVETIYTLEDLKIEKVGEDKMLLQIEPAVSLQKIDRVGIMLRHADTSKPELVNVTTAHGKFFAPALSLVGEEVQEDLRAWVSDSNTVRVALKDESIHSKNKGHQYLKELDSFGLDFHTPIKERLSLSIGENSALVDESTGDPIKLVNLGMEEVNARSNAYQNLYNSTLQLPNIPQFVKAFQALHAFDIDDSVKCQPRLETENLLLGYKKWIITDKATLPESDGELINSLVNLNKWRIQYSLPRMVSYSIDGGKTNFHDFLNPWSVDNFVRSVKKMEKNCVFSELGLGEEIKGKQLMESYFEINTQVLIS